MPDAIVEEESVTTCLRVKAHHLQVAQRFKGISELIDLVVHRQDFKFVTTLCVEEEEQTIDDGQTVVLHLALKCVVGIVADGNIVILLPPV